MLASETAVAATTLTAPATRTADQRPFLPEARTFTLGGAEFSMEGAGAAGARTGTRTGVLSGVGAAAGFDTLGRVSGGRVDGGKAGAWDKSGARLAGASASAFAGVWIGASFAISEKAMARVA